MPDSPTLSQGIPPPPTLGYLHPMVQEVRVVPAQDWAQSGAQGTQLPTAKQASVAGPRGSAPGPALSILHCLYPVTPTTTLSTTLIHPCPVIGFLDSGSAGLSPPLKFPFLTNS